MILGVVATLALGSASFNFALVCAPKYPVGEMPILLW